MPDIIASLVDRCKQYIRHAKRRGTVGMSHGNLRQVIDLRGLHFANQNHFERCFAEALPLVKVKGFELYP